MQIQANGCDTVSLTDIQFSTRTIEVDKTCDCGNIAVIGCDDNLTCITPCQLAEEIFACKCVDLFDLCCMPECKEGTYMRVNNCSSCPDKYEFVTACEIWNEIVQDDKCGFEVDIQCDTLEPLFEVCPALTGNSHHADRSIKCVGGKMQICGEIPEPFSCEKVMDCFPDDITTCEQTCEEIIAEVSNCPPCEDCEEPECEYKNLIYCPAEKKLALEENPHKVQCYRNSRGKGALQGGINIQMEAGEERGFYLSTTEIDANRGNIEWVGGADVLIDGQDGLPISWNHLVRNNAVGANGCHQVCTAGDYQIGFNFQVEINKTIHALRVGLMVVKKDGTVLLSIQNKLGGIDGFYYEKPEGCEIPEEVLCAHAGRSCENGYGQPNTPDLFYGPYGCNDYTSAIGGSSNPTNDTEGGGREGSTFSLGRVIESRTFAGTTREFLEPGDKVVPTIFISAAMNGDCDAKNNPYKAMTSILGDGVTTSGGATYGFNTTFEVIGLNDIEEKRCLVEKYGCCCGGVEGEDKDTCCCGAEPTVPETVELTPGEATYNPFEPPVEECEGPKSQADCPEGLEFGKLDPNSECGVCLPSTVPGTGASGEECGTGYERDADQGLCVFVGV